jgi:hypothetical protein
VPLHRSEFALIHRRDLGRGRKKVFFREEALDA